MLKRERKSLALALATIKANGAINEIARAERGERQTTGGGRGEMHETRRVWTCA